MNNELAQRIKLHIACFGDDPEWTERYIKRNDFLSRKITVCERKDKIAATLYLEPMELAVENAKIPFEFINCLGTLPELRYRGYATRLIKKTFETRRKTPMLALLPFNVEFYLKQGFVPLNTAKKETVSGNISFEIRDFTPKYYDFCKFAYSEFSKRFGAYAERSEDFLKWKFLDETKEGDGSIKILVKDGEAAGYVCFTENDEIGEYAMLPPYDISEVSELRGKRFLRFGKGSTYMMARICNAENMLGLIPYSERFCGSVNFNLTDNLIPRNEGNYTLSIDDGKLVNFEKRRISAHCGDTISAEVLTSLSIGCFDENDESVPARIRAAFKRRNTFFFDIF